MAEYFEEDDKDVKVKMEEHIEEDDKDVIEVLYDSTAGAVKKEELNEDKKDVKRELDDPDQHQHELEMMAKMNLPTQFVYSNGRFQDVKLKEDYKPFCSLCQVEMRSIQAYNAHVAGKKHLKKMISTSDRLQSR